MKKFFSIVVIIAAIFAVSVNVNAETKVERQGNTFVETKTKSSRSTCKETDFRYQYNGVDYPIFVNTKTGRCHIKVVSRNGNTYSKYLDETVEKAICGALNITWTPKKTKSTEQAD